MVIHRLAEEPVATRVRECSTSTRLGERDVLAGPDQLHTNQSTGIDTELAPTLSKVDGGDCGDGERHEAGVGHPGVIPTGCERDVVQTVQPQGVHREAIRIKHEDVTRRELDGSERAIERHMMIVCLALQHLGARLELKHPGDTWKAFQRGAV